MKKVVMVVFAAALMLLAAVFISAGDTIFENGGLTVTAASNTIGNVEFQDYNADCSGFRKGTTGGGIWSCTGTP